MFPFSARYTILNQTPGGCSSSKGICGMWSTTPGKGSGVVNVFMKCAIGRMCGIRQHGNWARRAVNSDESGFSSLMSSIRRMKHLRQTTSKEVGGRWCYVKGETSEDVQVW